MNPLRPRLRPRRPRRADLTRAVATIARESRSSRARSSPTSGASEAAPPTTTSCAYGNIPLFCTLGRAAEEVVAREGRPAVRTLAKLRFSYDERIEDGFNAVRALAHFRELMEHPEQLG